MKQLIEIGTLVMVVLAQITGFILLWVIIGNEAGWAQEWPLCVAVLLFWASGVGYALFTISDTERNWREL